MSSSDLKSNFPTSHDTAGYVGFANLPNQVTFLEKKNCLNFKIFTFLQLTKKGSSEICEERF